MLARWGTTLPWLACMALGQWHPHAGKVRHHTLLISLWLLLMKAACCEICASQWMTEEWEGEEEGLFTGGCFDWQFLSVASPAPQRMGKAAMGVGVGGICRTGNWLRSAVSYVIHLHDQWERSKHIKGSKERYLLGQKHGLQIFRVIPLVKLQNDT